MSAGKESELLTGALRVFARDGYSRASIQTLAAEAGVSTRTIYNRFGSKQGLFRAVILDSATRVAEREIAQAKRALGAPDDLREALVAFGLAWATPDPATAAHFALVRQIAADAEHIDSESLEAWRAAGPDRVRAAIGSLLRGLTDRGLLKIDDVDIAAAQLVQLTAGTVTATRTTDVDRVVGLGVDVFLAAYSAPRMND